MSQSVSFKKNGPMKPYDVLCTNWNSLTNYLLPAFNFVHRGATSFFLRKFPIREFPPYVREDIPDIIGKRVLKRNLGTSPQLEEWNDGVME
jgi:hypothetical protein